MSSWGGRRTRPYVFTEEGVAMLSGVLRSKRAVHANIAIMRAFVRLRRMALEHSHLTKRLDNLERQYNSQFKVVFGAIRELMSPQESPKRKIGYSIDKKPGV
jgi:hypothetical protein